MLKNTDGDSSLASSLENKVDVMDKTKIRNYLVSNYKNCDNPIGLTGGP